MATKPLSGLELIRILSEATGLPTSLVSSELNTLIAENGLSANSLSMDELRRVLADYLQETLLSASTKDFSDIAN